jgi:hypothetical protein
MSDTIEFLLDIYYQMNLPLTFPRDGKIDIRNLKKLLYLLCDNEDFRLKEVYRHPPKLGFKTLEVSVQSYRYRGELKIKLDKKEFQKNWYTKVFSPPPTKSKLIQDLPDSIYLDLFDPTDEKIESIVHDYINSFFWTYLYYKKGTSVVSPNFCYFCGYAPLIQDVLKFFSTYNYNISSIFKKDIKEDYSFTVLHQLLAVLPTKSIKIIPEDLHPFYRVDSLISDMFPVKVEVDTEAKDMERLGVVRMCPVEPKRLLSLDLGISKEKMERYVSQRDLCFKRKSNEKQIERDIVNTETVQNIKSDLRLSKVNMTERSIAEEMMKVEGCVSQEVLKDSDGGSKSVHSKVTTKFLQDFEKLKRLRKMCLKET